MNSSGSMMYDDHELSSMFELLEISNPNDSSAAANDHCHVSFNGNTPIANDWSISPDFLPQAENETLMRMRAQSAARGQLDFPTPYQNYPSSGHYNDINLLLGNSSSNHGRVSLNAGASTYNLHAYQSQMNSSLREQSFYSNRSWDPNNLAYMHNGFRRRRNIYSLEDWRARIFFLEKKLEELDSKGIHVICSEVKDYIGELMVDQLGSLLIQSFFEDCNEEQMDRLLLLVFYDHHVLVDICGDTHGTRSMQKLLENLTTGAQRFLVLSVLGHLTSILSKSLFGRHVIQHCLIHFPNEETTQIQSVIADECLEFATDKYGCCVVQVCVEYTRGKDCLEILAQLARNAVSLSEHPYGNYVVSKLVMLKIPSVTAKILEQLAGNYVSLSMNKHGSNVVETCLRQTQGHQPLQIIMEIIESPCFLMVLQDRYGNYVAQSALDVSKGNDVHVLMIWRIRDHFKALQSHLYGKRVLARITGNRGRV